MSGHSGLPFNSCTEALQIKCKSSASHVAKGQVLYLHDVVLVLADQNSGGNKRC